MVSVFTENKCDKWRHTNPLTGTRGESGADGEYVTTIEADPLGVNVGVEDPWIEPEPEGFSPDPDMPAIGGINGSGCSSSNPYCQKCYLDGMEMECVQVAFLSDIGSTVRCPNDNCGPQVKDGRLSPLTFDPETGRLVYGHWERVDLVTRNQETGEVIDVYSGRPQFVVDGSAVTDSFFFGRRRTQQTEQPLTPIVGPLQDPAMRPLSREGVSYVIDTAIDLLNNNPKCEEMLNKVLSKMAANTKVKGKYGTIREILEQFRKEGTIYPGGYGSSHAHGGFGDNAAIDLYMSTTGETANRLLHELLHIAGGRNYNEHWGGGYYPPYYGDDKIAQAWNELGVIMTPEEWRASSIPTGPWALATQLSSAAQGYICRGAISELIQESQRLGYR